jgi:ABC-2 type transport system ATP-binding protein
MTTLDIRKLSFNFDSGPVFRDFDLQCGAGVHWLHGPNGAGKTTLMRLACGALRPHGGRLAIDGVDSAAAPAQYRARVFYCGGEEPDLPWLTVREYLELHAALYGLADGAAIQPHLAAFGVDGTLGQGINTLSLGQHKKVQLALAMALPVKLLLLDEPFNGLDAAAARVLEQYLDSSTAAVVLASHQEPHIALAGTIALRPIRAGT